MDRRQFLKGMISSAAFLGGGAGSMLSNKALAACNLPQVPKTLVNIMLYGGADLRYLFVPSPNGGASMDYVDAFWAARRNIYTTDINALYSGSEANPGIFETEYDELTDSTGYKFGIHKRCGWLRDQFELGNVAIIANSFCSRNRRHDQSQLNANVGEPEYDDLIYDREGWGGRLLEQLANPAENVVELSHEISVFCNGTSPGERLKQVIHAQNMRDIALPNAGSGTGSGDVTIRALRSYYEARGAEVAIEKPADWPYHLFFQHNTAFRDFGGLVKTQLDSCGGLPGSLLALNLHRHHFRQQCWNLYDGALAANILGNRVVSMRYDGWDTHSNQKIGIENNLEDLFGLAGIGGLATTTGELSLLANNANDNMVFLFSTDFGRQLSANGARGTDHGRGVYTILIGEAVNGGIYGDMFPEYEITPGDNGVSPYERQGADIEGQTSVERIYAAACDWMKGDSGKQVFPGAENSDLESGVVLANLLS